MFKKGEERERSKPGEARRSAVGGYLRLHP